MIKPDKTVMKETGFMAVFSLIASVLMQAVFLVIGKWDLSVLLGNLIGCSAGILNFFLMGLSVQYSCDKNEKDAASFMRVSQLLRMFMLFLVCILGAVLSCFNVVTTLIPLFFTRIAVFFRQSFMKKDGGDSDGGNKKETDLRK